MYDDSHTLKAALAAKKKIETAVCTFLGQLNIRLHEQQLWLQNSAALLFPEVEETKDDSVGCFAGAGAAIHPAQAMDLPPASS